MKAFILKHTKTENFLELENIAKPQIEPHQILIKTKAVSLNPVDYKVTQGAFNLPTPITVGIDVAGEVVETGTAVKNMAIGNRVCAMVNIFNTGSFAEYVVVDSQITTKIPENLSFEQASTIPCAGITAWQAIMQKINLQKGQTVFITAGGGGVGGYAIQLAKRKGAQVITSASKDFERIQGLGANHIINYKEKDVVEEVLKLTNNTGVDFMIDAISGAHAADNAPMLRFNGIMVCITGLPQQYPFAPFTKAAGMIEVALVAAYNSKSKQSLTEVADAGAQLAELIAKKEISANITKSIKFSEIPNGLKLISSGHCSGKIVAIL